MTDTASPIDAVLRERDRTHGKFNEAAERAQRLRTVMINSPNWRQLTDSQRESLEMICGKLARILVGDPNHRDHWVDIGGYARLVVEELADGRG